MPRIRNADSGGSFRGCLLLTLLFLGSAYTQVHGVTTRQMDSANASGVLACCNPESASGQLPGDSDPASGTTDSSDPLESESIPIDLVAALGRPLEDILVEAETTLGRLRSLRRESDLFLGIDADADDRLIYRFWILENRLSRLISRLRETAKTTAVTRLSALEQNLRDEAIRLFLANRRLQLLLDAKGQCGLHNLGSFLSSVESLSLEFASGRTGTAGKEPGYFFFENQLPNVVPESGGRLFLYWPQIPQEGSLQAILLDPERGTTLASLDLRREPSSGLATTRIEPRWIAEHAGRCLSLNVANTISRGMLWWKQQQSETQVQLPFCISRSFDTKYRIAGHLEYRTPTQERYLIAKAVLFENDSCSDRKQVTQTIEWPLSPGGQLIDTGESALYEAGTSSIDCELSENRVTCSGYLGKAVCGRSMNSGGQAMDGDLLLEQAEWEHTFSPIVEIPIEEEHKGQAVSELLELVSPDAEITLKVPREEPSESTTIWYELIVVNGGQQKTVFTSPRIALREREQFIYQTDHNRMIASLDPARESAESDIHVNIEPVSCPY